MPAALQSSLVVAFSHRNRSQPAPRALSPGNCETLRSDNGATGAGGCGDIARGVTWQCSGSAGGSGHRFHEAPTRKCLLFSHGALPVVQPPATPTCGRPKSLNVAIVHPRTTFTLPDGTPGAGRYTDV